MSNSLSVAAVTAAIAELLRFALAEGNDGTVPGARVTHLRPGDPALDDGAATVNLYLLSAGMDAASRNADLPTRGPAARRGGIPPLPLSLSYLVSFHGDEGRLEPQRLMGMAAIALHAQPVLSRALIAEAVRATPWLAGSDLADADRPVSVLLSPFSDAETIGRVWRTLSGQRHLALLYTASIVSLDA